jgi:signal transduction histidine kinase
MDHSFHRLTEPHPDLQSIDVQRPVRYMLSMNLIFIVVNAIGIIALWTILSNPVEIKVFYIVPGTMALLLAVLAYFAGKTERYLRGVVLLIAACVALSYGGILTTPGNTAYNYTSIAIAGVIISGLFLDKRSTGRIGLLIAVGLAVTLALGRPLVTANLLPDRYAPPDTFAIVLSVLISLGMTAIVITFMRLRDALEADRLTERTRAVEQEQLAAAYKRADEVKSTFLASMSHELRTPLNAIINFTRFVAKGAMGPVNDEQVEALDEVIDSAKHLLNLINDVLDMSKIEAGSLQLFVEPDVDVKAIIKSVGATAKTLVADKPVDVQVEVAEDMPTITGDRQRILQILLNITSNASKFTDKGRISIRATHENGEVLFAIEDTGPGIPEADQPLVFEAFKQTASGLRKGGGTGLGMPISRSLVEAHGGRLWLESTVGAGTTFYVTLPVKAVTSETVLAV